MTTPFSITAPRFEVKEWESELESMPVDEKAKATQDLYGKTEPINETPEFLLSKMEELQVHLQQIEGDADAFLEAQRRVPDVVNSFEFRLMFLRAVLFDTKVAAKKIVKYWTYKVKLFGPAIAFREGGKIMISDLDDDDLATVDARSLFWLPKDEAGRGVLFSRRQGWSYRTPINLSRLSWYLVQVAMEDPSIQRNGIVVIMYNVGNYSIVEHFDRKAMNLLLQFAFQSLPMRVVGVHHCYTSKIYNIVLPFILFFFGKDVRARHRLHSVPDQIVPELLKFGLTMDSLPTEMGGQLVIDPVAWREERRLKDEQQANPGG